MECVQFCSSMGHTNVLRAPLEYLGTRLGLALTNDVCIVVKSFNWLCMYVLFQNPQIKPHETILKKEVPITTESICPIHRKPTGRNYVHSYTEGAIVG